MTKNNRRYAAYPKQRDLAQVFVRWALDHLTEEGVCGYNTIETWLNVKISDGALETRKLIIDRLCEVVQNEAIMRYSENKNDGGGEIPTFIFCFGQLNAGVVLDDITHDYTKDEFLVPGFLNNLRNRTIKYPFVDKQAYTYLERFKGVRSPQRHNSKSKPPQFSFYNCGGGDDYYLVSKEGIYEHTYSNNWRLLYGAEIGTYLSDTFTGESKFAKARSREHGLWLLGYFNTEIAKSYVHTYCKIAPNHGGWMAVLAAGRFASCQVPDFDHYKQDRPTKFEAYMTWVEANMRDKDAFLAGIDEQFEALISD